MGKKLLVADDSVTIQKVIKLALSSESYDIMAVSSGKEALKAIEEELPDVVLIDVALPQMDACAIKEKVNENPTLSLIGFVLMASAFEKIDERKVAEVGFEGRLIKPFDPSHLRKAVSELMNRDKKKDAPKEPTRETKAPTFDPSILNREVSSFNIAPSVEPKSDFTSDSVIELSEPIQIVSPPAIQDQDLPPVMPELPTLEVPPITPPDEDEDEELIAQNEVKESQKLENDIKNLTESTIKMSGLDDFEWNLDDSKKMKTPPKIEKVERVEKTIELSREPTLIQERRQIDDGGSSFPIQDLKPSKAERPVGMPARPSGLNMITPVTPPPAISQSTKEEFSSKIQSTLKSSLESGVQDTANKYSNLISRAEIEELIRKDIEVAVEKLARETVPQMAEEIIRREIDRILAEP